MALLCKLFALLFEYNTSNTSCTVQSRLFSLETREPNTQPRRCPRKRRVTTYPYYQRMPVYHTPWPRILPPEWKRRRSTALECNAGHIQPHALFSRLRFQNRLVWRSFPLRAVPLQESRILDHPPRPCCTRPGRRFRSCRMRNPDQLHIAHKFRPLRTHQVQLTLAYAKLSLLSTPMSSSSAKLWKCTGRCVSL